MIRALIFFCVVSLVSLKAHAQDVDANFLQYILIPVEQSRIVEPEFRVNKEESAGDPYRRNHQARPAEDEYFCGYRVRIEGDMINSVFEVHSVGTGSAIYHVSVANGRGSGRLVANFDSRYVKKSYFKDKTDEEIVAACQSDGWSMSHAKRSREYSNRGAPFECRSDGFKYCRDYSTGEYYGCGRCGG